MRRKRNTPPLSVREQIFTATLEIGRVVPQKFGNQSISRLSITILGHFPKECLIIPKHHLLKYVLDNIIHNSQNLGKT